MQATNRYRQPPQQETCSERCTEKPPQWFKGPREIPGTPGTGWWRAGVQRGQWSLGVRSSGRPGACGASTTAELCGLRSAILEFCVWLGRIPTSYGSVQNASYEPRLCAAIEWMQPVAVEAGKLRGWEVSVTREKTTGLQVASEWKLGGVRRAGIDVEVRSPGDLENLHNGARPGKHGPAGRPHLCTIQNDYTVLALDPWMASVPIAPHREREQQLTSHRRGAVTRRRGRVEGGV
jgi:hypothetical protein